ncbi:hypothetical protein BO86DRAFT_250590 [Aspergillus japonicus CBS 114.51]|uniref:Uncharacterized protein n=1 Tax=Aspergillus japonicus CBS 114.51 TaxID=1448312 RepID=A0A8T8WM49_ASPJA|nr:hypothetical protein BO86DRAFT_250590 [Aspergillus japonicus CBS 114.51]RAH76479.1 hypothetical protein BO86DRAFT_250590 [Aspergillus japonicus CBS 114.51]
MRLGSITQFARRLHGVFWGVFLGCVLISRWLFCCGCCERSASTVTLLRRGEWAWESLSRY